MPQRSTHAPRAASAAIVSGVIWHRLRALAAALLGLLALITMAARLAGRRPPRQPGHLGGTPVQAAALAPAGAVAGVASVALAATVAWWLAALLAIPAAMLAASQLPRWRRRHGGGAESPAAAAAADQAPATLRILTLNAMFGAADPDATVAAVRDYQVDVLAVQELTNGLVRRLAEAGLLDLLPNVHADLQPGAAGAGLWSRWALTPLPPVPDLLLAAPSARVSAGGHEVTVRSVHPVAPMIGRHGLWHEDLTRLRAAMAAQPGPQVVAGDFNASRDHRPFRDLLAAGFADSADIAAKRPWPGFTWPANRRYPPVMRLDHILVSPGITVSETRAVSIPGTDHRGVLAVLELASPALRPAARRPAECATR
jgi:endonuclease/exonuclease/phosphatase family metal-dependent hydrolase